MMIKVASRTITRTINSFGFGSNITVDYTVSQEATLILEEPVPSAPLPHV